MIRPGSTPHGRPGVALRACRCWFSIAAGALALGAIPSAMPAQPTPMRDESGPGVASDPIAADPVEEEPTLADDLDPSRLVFFNLRLTHAELGGDNSSDVLLLRRDVALRRPHSDQPGKRLALLRFDLPVGRAQLGGEEHRGLGDLYAQALRVREFPGPFYLSYGLAMTLPTATADVLGTGQWQVTPTLIPTWALKRSRALAFVRIQDSVSFAGDDERADVHDLTVNGSFAKMLTRRTFVMFETEAVVDWARGDQVSWKSGLSWGGLVRSGRVAWLKLFVPWGENRRGEWLLTASLVLRKNTESAKSRAKPGP